MEVLITIPHGAPDEEDGTHPADTGALDFVGFLEDALEGVNLKPVTHIGTISRDVLDLNRLRAHSHRWHGEFRQMLKTADLHIDLHSFPEVEDYENDPSKYQTSTGYDLRVWSTGHLVVFFTPEITDPELVKSIEESVVEAGMEVTDQEGGFENYVSNVANVLMDTPSVLLEINEGENQDYQALAMAVALGIRDYLDSFGPSLQSDEPLPAELS